MKLRKAGKSSAGFVFSVGLRKLHFLRSQRATTIRTIKERGFSGVVTAKGVKFEY